VGHKGGKQRDIDLINEARQPLYVYLERTTDPARPFVFVSQCANQFTAAGIHHWFRTLKAQATHTEWLLIRDIAFHELRHHFAHRAQAAGRWQKSPGISARSPIAAHQRSRPPSAPCRSAATRYAPSWRRYAAMLSMTCRLPTSLPMMNAPSHLKDLLDYDWLVPAAA
jgi:hypothetical protein